MKASQAGIFWTPANWPAEHPAKGQIEVARIGTPQAAAAWDRHAYKCGAAFSEWKQAAGDRAIGLVFIEFQTAVVRDRIDPQAAHEAFLAIDEYRDGCAPDTPGASN